MDPYERTHLCDGAKELKFKPGDVIIQQGEHGDKFYMISEGELTALRKDHDPETDSIQEKQVFEYKSGDYFGELALIQNVAR